VRAAEKSGYPTLDVALIGGTDPLFRQAGIDLDEG